MRNSYTEIDLKNTTSIFMKISFNLQPIYQSVLLILPSSHLKLAIQLKFIKH